MSGHGTAGIQIRQRLSASLQRIRSKYSRTPQISKRDQQMRGLVVGQLMPEDTVTLDFMRPNLLPLTQIPTTTFNPGELIGNRFRVERAIAVGGEGTVYECSDLSYPDTVVAVKVINSPDQVDNMKFEVADLQVMRGLPSLGSRGVAGLQGYSENFEYVVMRLVRGRPLKEYTMREFSQRGIYDFFRGTREATDETDYALAALRIIREVLAVLEYAHAKDIIHADICSKNVLVSEEGEELEVTVVDWGLGKVYDELDEGIMVGKPPYMAPEQVRTEAINGQSDVYAAGITLYSILAGRSPFGYLRGEGRNDSALDRRALGDAFGLPLLTVSRDEVIGIFGQEDSSWHSFVVDPGKEELQLLYFDDAVINEIENEDIRNKFSQLVTQRRMAQTRNIFSHLGLKVGLERKIHQLLARMTAARRDGRYDATEAIAAIGGILAAHDIAVS